VALLRLEVRAVVGGARQVELQRHVLRRALRGAAQLARGVLEQEAGAAVPHLDAPARQPEHRAPQLELQRGVVGTRFELRLERLEQVLVLHRARALVGRHGRQHLGARVPRGVEQLVQALVRHHRVREAQRARAQLAVGIELREDLQQPAR
jgi:hypothetical protein